jgi:hypothetical protein
MIDSASLTSAVPPPVPRWGTGGVTADLDFNKSQPQGTKVPSARAGAPHTLINSPSGTLTDARRQGTSPLAGRAYISPIVDNDVCVSGVGGVFARGPARPDETHSDQRAPEETLGANSADYVGGVTPGNLRTDGNFAHPEAENSAKFSGVPHTAPDHRAEVFELPRGALKLQPPSYGSAGLPALPVAAAAPPPRSTCPTQGSTLPRPPGLSQEIGSAPTFGAPLRGAPVDEDAFVRTASRGGGNGDDVCVTSLVDSSGNVGAPERAHSKGVLLSAARDDGIQERGFGGRAVEHASSSQKGAVASYVLPSLPVVTPRVLMMAGSQTPLCQPGPPTTLHRSPGAR